MDRFFRLFFLMTFLCANYSFCMNLCMSFAEKERVGDIAQLLYSREFTSKRNSIEEWANFPFSEYVDRKDRVGERLLANTLLTKFYEQAQNGISHNVYNAFEVLKQASLKKGSKVLLETHFTYDASYHCLQKRYQPGMMYSAKEIHQKVFEEIGKDLKVNLLFIDYESFEEDENTREYVIKSDILEQIQHNDAIVYIESCSLFNRDSQQRIEEFLKLSQCNKPLILCADNVHSEANSLKSFNELICKNPTDILAPSKDLFSSLPIIKIEHVKQKYDEIRKQEDSLKLNVVTSIQAHQEDVLKPDGSKEVQKKGPIKNIILLGGCCILLGVAIFQYNKPLIEFFSNIFNFSSNISFIKTNR